MFFSTFNASNLESDLPVEPSMASFPDQSIWLHAVMESLIDGVLVLSANGDVVHCNSRGRQICKRLRRQSLEVLSTLEPTWMDGINGATYSQPHNVRIQRDQLRTLAEGKGVPLPIRTICQMVLDSQQDFPGITLVPEYQLILPSTDTEENLRLRLRAQWFSAPPQMTGDRLDQWTIDSDPNMDSDVDSNMNPLPEQSYILVTMEDRNQSIQHLVTADQTRYRLTPRETEIWQMRLLGQSYRDIAERLIISTNTVKKHLKNILAKRRDVLREVS